MGFLKEDKVLDWSNMVNYTTNYKYIGLLQFIEIYHKYKNNLSTPYYWGYELEYTLLKIDGVGNYRLLSKADKLLKKLDNRIWKPEYSNWMIEMIPLQPYDNKLSNLKYLETEITNDLTKIKTHLEEDEYLVLMSSYPLLGAPNFYLPKIKKELQYNNYSQSKKVVDNLINPHIRFKTLTQNIRKRKTEKINIEIPIYKDTYTTEPNITMDAMIYGMSCCALQQTIQLQNLEDCLYLYDQMAVLSPILLSLSSSTVLLNGYISNLDNRWNVIEQSVDDRKPGEKINKSRYSSISTFIHPLGDNYNDIGIEYNKEYFNILLENEIPSNIARHISHLFVRDPILMYQDDLDIIYNKFSWKTQTDFFHNVNSSNWNNMRLKPPLDKGDSWKIEIRSQDIQPTIFQNVALLVFNLLLVRMIDYYKLNLYIPISKLDKNFKTSFEMNSIQKMYYFRNNIEPDSLDNSNYYSINSIINGSNGLIHYIYKYLNDTNQQDKLTHLEPYLQYIIELSSQIITTPAQQIRDYVINHNDYYKDSKVNPVIVNDMINTIYELL